MTWATVDGIRVWNHKSFPEPTDEELEQYGWINPAKPSKRPAVGHHACISCDTLIRTRNSRCQACYNALRRAQAKEQPRHLHEVDEVAVRRVLNGEWRMKTTKAEKVAVCESWVKAGNSLSELSRLTGWRTERYYKTSESRDAA